MVTLVGTQSNFADALIELVELEYDAKEAYETAINRLEDAHYKSKLSEFLADHQRHIHELTGLLQQHGLAAPKGPSLAKQWLAKGKVVLANIVGDKSILMAMRSNEIDTNVAYERIYNHADKWVDAEDIVKRGLEDEHRHKAWLDETLGA